MLPPETPGEAVLTGASNFVAQAKVSREQVRSANKETLLEIINNENIGDEQKQEAIASMVKNDRPGRAGGSCGTAAGRKRI